MLLLMLALVEAFTMSIIANAEDVTLLISEAEKEYNIPKGLLLAIAEVESDLNPHAVGVEGRAITTRSKEESSRAINHHLKSGSTNIDIGVMQVNYHWHGKSFNDIREMLEPSKNVAYAAKLLKTLYDKHHDWQKAVRHYHSATPEHHKKYSRKIILTWLK